MALKSSSGANVGLHLFDAKFRVQKFVELPPGDHVKVVGCIAVEERSGTLKQADLYKMHTYRDSIEKARSVLDTVPRERASILST